MIAVAVRQGAGGEERKEKEGFFIQSSPPIASPYSLYQRIGRLSPNEEAPPTFLLASRIRCHSRAFAPQRPTAGTRALKRTRSLP